LVFESDFFKCDNQNGRCIIDVWLPSWLFYYLTPFLIVYGVVKRKAVLQTVEKYANLLSALDQPNRQQPNRYREQELERLRQYYLRNGIPLPADLQRVPPRQPAVPAPRKQAPPPEKTPLEKFGAYLGRKMVKHPINILKVLISLSLLTTWEVSPFSVLGIFGLYRFSNAVWKDKFKELIDIYKRFAQKFFEGATREFPLRQKILILLGLSGFVAANIIFSSFGFLFSAAYIMGHLVLISIGARAMWGDVRFGYHNPVKAFSENTGKILGAFWGRTTAYRTYSGFITGNLGFAWGSVQNPGLGGGLISSLLTPRGLFMFGNSALSMYGQQVSTSFKSIFSGLLFSTQATTMGNFTGTVGPTSAQIVTYMIFGSLIGYGIEKLVDRIYRSLVLDSYLLKQETLIQGKTASDIILEKAAQSKWKITYTIMSTPIVLMSEGGKHMIAALGGSVFLAAFATIALTAVSFIAYAKLRQKMIDVIAHRRAARAHRVVPPVAAKPAAALVPVAPAPREGYLPGFLGGRRPPARPIVLSPEEEMSIACYRTLVC